MPESMALCDPLMRATLPTAFGDGPGAIGDAFGALEGRGDGRMCLEALKFLKGRQIGIFIIEMQNKTDSDQIVFQVVEE